MQWIKQFSKGTFGLFSGNTIEAFQPLDFYHFYPLWYDLWINRIKQIIKTLNLENKSYSEIKELLPPPSNIRAILVKMIPAYNGLQYDKNPKDFKAVADFLARMLIESCSRDPFAEHSNPYHTEVEIKALIDNLEWRDANISIAREIGQFITAAGSLVHGLYNDVVTDFGWDAYGPYKINYGGNGYTLIIRHFTNLAPHELWNRNFLASVKEVIIYALYQNVEWEIATVGCHTIAKNGSPVDGLRKYTILVDGSEINNSKLKNLIDECSEKAELIYRKIRKMSFEELKKKVMLQECYQFNKMFKAADIDWKPTDEMHVRIKGKPLLQGIVPRDKMMSTVEEYVKFFGIEEFAQEVLGQEIK